MIGQFGRVRGGPRRRSIRWGVGVLGVAVLAAIAAVGGWPLGGSAGSRDGAAPRATAASDVRPGNPFRNTASVNARYAIAAPGSGEVTDGGLVIEPTGGPAAILTDVRVLDGGRPAPLRVVDARVNTLRGNTRAAVGVRQGLPTANPDAGAGVPVRGATLARTAGSTYELILGLRAPGDRGRGTCPR